MAIREVRAAVRGYLALATALLQRVRMADAEAGVWEAADLQWWWRMPRRSDSIEQLFWADNQGAVAAVVLTDWGTRWSCDPILVPGVVPLPLVWERALEVIRALRLERVEVFARDDDGPLLTLLDATGFGRGDEESGITWMNVPPDRPAPAAPPAGTRIVDRETSAAGPHPMARRNGAAVEARLRECSLYDPALDLAAEADDGTVAGYALFWLDPVTRVGLVEPMRVEDAYQRRGIARALLTIGLDRLVARGAKRLKVGYGSEAARRLYLGVGFRLTSTARTYRRSRSGTEPDCVRRRRGDAR